MIYTNEKIVVQCNGCPFFESGKEAMECRHPYFDNVESPYERLIITRENSNGTVPELCPLRLGDVEVTVNVKLRL